MLIFVERLPTFPSPEILIPAFTTVPNDALLPPSLPSLLLSLPRSN